MRILFVSSSSGSRGGGELYLLYLAEAMRRRGHVVALWCASDPVMDELAEAFTEYGEVLRTNYINTYRRLARSYWYWMPQFSLPRLTRQWLQWRPDVIHLNKQCLEDGLDLLGAANTLPTQQRHCCTIHITQTASALGARGAGLRDSIARRHLLDYKGSLIAIGPNRQRELETFLQHSRRVTCIPNGVGIPGISEIEGLRQQCRSKLGIHGEATQLVIGVGRLEEQKRPMLFLSLARQLLEKNPDARFIWIGDGRLRERFEATIKVQNLTDKVSCIGWQRDVKPYLAGADLYVHPAAFEGLPFALLEAMAWRLPCVIMPELAVELNFLSPAQIAVARESDRTWIEQISESSQRAALAEAGRRLVENEFSVEAMAGSYEQHYAQKVLEVSK